MANDTRKMLLNQAETLFAERGFYGASISAIANELGLTKQALLHHFESKEKLYGEVLHRISKQFENLGEVSNTLDPTERLVAVFTGLLPRSAERTTHTRILMRELLDNRRRADTAGTWYLKSFLETLICMVQDVPAWRDASKAEALALIYQWLGAINYFVISEPTLIGIFGRDSFNALSKTYPNQFQSLMRASLKTR